MVVADASQSLLKRRFFELLVFVKLFSFRKGIVLKYMTYLWYPCYSKMQLNS